MNVVHPQMQPGVPATFSGEAETRTLKRRACDVMQLRETLGGKKLEVESGGIWFAATVDGCHRRITTAKR